MKLSCVATDIAGISGRTMLDTPVARERHRTVLAEMAQRRRTP